MQTNNQHSNPRRPSGRAALAMVICQVLASCNVFAVGHFVQIDNNPPDGRGGGSPMLLLSDGTVMAAYFGGTNWYKLTPLNGSYIHGAWTSLALMQQGNRQFFSSDVLRDGRVFVAGGELGSGFATAEIYDPLIDFWINVSPPIGFLNTNSSVNSAGDNNNGFIDSDSVVLADGRVLIAPVAPLPPGNTFIYDPVQGSWSRAALTNGAASTDEQSWVKFPDGSVITFDSNFHSQRFIPSLNQWIADQNLPVQLYSANSEIGPGFLLPDGRAFFLGGTGHTLYYTPSGNTSFGSWAQGPDIPNGMVAGDEPSAMMVNGKILCTVSPSTAPTTNGSRAVYFCEFDYSANSFNTNVTSPTGGFSDTSHIPDWCSMLALPDGTILFSDDANIYVYQPDGSPVPQGKPTITSIIRNPNGSYHLAGTKLNGISQGASYGDDMQMDSNYPLVRMTDGSSHTNYARTYNWSTAGVNTGTTPVTTEFTLPLFALQNPGNYSLVVIANGNPSDPVSFTVPASTWVDFNYTGATQNGSYVDPFPTLAQGVSAVPTGGTIFIRSAGSSHETMTISKPMTILAYNGAATIGH